jgi:hypothetical protein
MARVMGARALAALVSAEDAPSVIDQLLTGLPCTESKQSLEKPLRVTSHNAAHGSLLQVTFYCSFGSAQALMRA